MLFKISNCVLFAITNLTNSILKKILIIRHCKSEWELTGLSDHDRPLNSRGKRDIPRIADRLSVLNPSLDKVYHSTARRASDTANGIFSHMGSIVPLVPRKDLYTFSSDEVVTFIHNLPEDESSIAIVCHNPAMTEFIQDFTQIQLDNLPTGGFCLIHFEIDDWSEMSENTGTVKFLEYPKMLK
jgi:phosphohistidine phosphatase